MFDMTNPNIYKVIVPAAGLYGLTQSNIKADGGYVGNYGEVSNEIKHGV